jgi:predicted ester cyclase
LRLHGSSDLARRTRLAIVGKNAVSVDNKAIVIQHLERAWNQNNVDTLEKCISPEAVIYSGSRSDPFGPAQVRARIKLWRDAAADFQWHIEDLISEGDSVVARLTFTGTHTGMLAVVSRTLPATVSHSRWER